MIRVKNKTGAPSKYESHIKSRFNEIKEWLESGATEKEIAKNLGIAESTYFKLKKENGEFSEFVKNNRKIPVVEIKKAMMKRAVGFQYEEKRVITKYIEYDTGEILVPARVVTTEIITKTALPDVGAGLVLLQHWDLDENGKTKWSRDLSSKEIKEEELELKKKQVENETW